MKQSPTDEYEIVIQELASRLLEIDSIKLEHIISIGWKEIESFYPEIENIVNEMKIAGLVSITYRQREIALSIALKQQICQLPKQR